MGILSSKPRKNNQENRSSLKRIGSNKKYNRNPTNSNGRNQNDYQHPSSTPMQANKNQKSSAQNGAQAPVKYPTPKHGEHAIPPPAPPAAIQANNFKTIMPNGDNPRSNGRNNGDKRAVSSTPEARIPEKQEETSAGQKVKPKEDPLTADHGQRPQSPSEGLADLRTLNKQQADASKKHNKPKEVSAISEDYKLSPIVNENSENPQSLSEMKTETETPAVQTTKSLSTKSRKLESCDEQTLKLIEEEFQKGLDSCAKRHKEIMHKLIDRNEPFTEAQLTEYHEKNKEMIIDAYEKAYYEPLSIHNFENVRKLFEDHKQKLRSTIKSQLVAYLRKHEITIEKVSKMVKDVTNDAETLYEEMMSQFGYTSTTEEKAAVYENECQIAAVQKFNELLKKKGLEVAEFWLHELNFKLGEHRKEFLRNLNADGSITAEPSNPEPEHTALVSSANPSQTNNRESEHHAKRQNKDQTEIRESSKSRKLERQMNTNSFSKVSGLTEQEPSMNSTSTALVSASSIEEHQEDGENTTGQEGGDKSGSGNSAKLYKINKMEGADQPNTPNKINIGIYVDEVSMLVGTFKVQDSASPCSSPTFDPFVECHPSIVFIDNAVIIGSEASKYEGNTNHFDFYPLLSAKGQGRVRSRSASSGKYKFPIHLKQNKLYLSTEDIMAAFVWTLLKKLEEMTSSYIDQIVFTVPAALSNVEKQRLKSAVGLAGFQKNARVISTSLSTAISHSYKVAVKENLSQKQPNRTFIFSISVILHYQKNSFSIAIVESCMHVIEVKKIITSVHYTDGGKEQVSFFQNHGHLYGNGEVSQEGYTAVSNVYRKAIQEIFVAAKQHYKNPLFDSFIIVRRAPSKKLDRMIKQLIILNATIPVHVKIVERSLVGGPLLGSSALASALPEHVTGVHDLSPLKVKLYMNDVEQEYSEEPLINRASGTIPDVTGLILFKYKFAVANEGTLRIKILEEVGGIGNGELGKILVDACHYHLKIRCEQPRQEYLMTLVCAMDQDGMYSLSVNNPWTTEVNIDVLKVANSNVPTSNHSSGFEKLIRFYSKSK